MGELHSACGVGATKDRASVEARHLFSEPLSKVGNLCVDTEGVRLGTAEAPADNSHQRHGEVLGRISSH